MPLSTVVAFTLAAATSEPSLHRCGDSFLRAGEHELHVKDWGRPGDVTVLFESGNGNDGNVWDDMAKRLRDRGLRTIQYDRAGLGQSGPRPGEHYDVVREVSVIGELLDHCLVSAPVLLVAHSYGGMTGLMLAERDERIAAVLLLDAIIPDDPTPDRVEAILEEYRPQYAAVREAAPALADHIIPLMEAWPQSAAIFANVELDPRLPIYSLVTDGALATETEQRDWRASHRAFATASPYRFVRIDESAGHKVVAERPDWVEASAMQLVEWIRGGKARGE
ncbi:alpha/beta fold hydrolase [Sphingomicrobium arenosum]|uniref:alpha/beta fold hydrolase n=1 Tax=Sphingomicrobium arenosum TaxID=2233861 RepID=UPI002240A9A6|nr:alpha/beta fold hydrolase [Sphingomicrobium arenosum]